MKIDRLEAHDRLNEFQKQSDYISLGCEECIRNRPEEFGSHPFYIFAHARTHDDGVSKRLIWTPRLTKPKSQTNSMLFKAYPGTDIIKIIWMIPDRLLWPQYKKGNLTEHKIICESIYDFENNRQKLDAKEDDDLPDETIDAIFIQISVNASRTKLMSDLYFIRPNEEVASTS